MPNLYVIDTHALLWYLDSNSKLGHQAQNILSDPSARFWLPAIALAEALFILEKRHTQFSIDESFLLQAINSDSRIAVIDLSQLIVTETLLYKSISEMHDRQIVATALIAQKAGFHVALLTKDANILASGLVNVVW